MIVFTIGTSEPFDRLISVADTVADVCEEKVLVQSGRSKCRFVRAEAVSFVPYDELLRLVSEARIIVTHAGAGSTLLALGQGKRPVLVPRRAEYGEAVDDHQVSFAERMADLGLAHVVNDPVNLAEFLRTMPGDDEHPSARTHSLAEALRVHLAELLGPPSGTS